MDRPDGRTNRAVYVISVAAELAGVHPQTLRIYERKGLLDPARTLGGSRRYSERDIDQLRRIQDLTTAGCNLEDTDHSQAGHALRDAQWQRLQAARTVGRR